jgi:hypothetical protein
MLSHVRFIFDGQDGDSRNNRMNKIYKVVWSKAKQCYVVISELAKCQTKGCGARSVRMAAVSMGVAAALLGGVCGSIAEATIAPVSGGGSIAYVQTDYRGMYTFQADTKTFTVDEAATSDTKKYAYGNVAVGTPHVESNWVMGDGTLVREDTIFCCAVYNDGFN